MKLSLYLAAALVLTLTGTSARPANNIARALYVSITQPNSKAEKIENVYEKLIEIIFYSKQRCKQRW
jgi:hypothetical protein